MDKATKLFIERAKQRMEQLGINKSELARRLKVAPGNVSRYLSGEFAPGIIQITKYATALECEPSFLTGAEATIVEVSAKRTRFDVAMEMLAEYLPAGDRKDAVLFLLTCSDDAFESVIGGLNPFLEAAREGKQSSSG